MPSTLCDEQAVRRELERVLKSDGFARNDRLSRFLRSVVERHLEGKNDELKESLLAIEVFGRSPDYDPKRDPIVRTEAGRLRARLSEYYMGEGRRDTLIIDLPKGGYIPAFREQQQEISSDPVPQTSNEHGKNPFTRPWIIVAIGCLASASILLGWRWFDRQNVPIPIAVLPFHNLSQDPKNDYFADGLTDEIIRNLSIIDGLAVRSQTSSFVFKDKPRNMREAGEQLKADYILEGSVLRAGERLRINAQLVRVHDDFALWSGRYDRELTDIFAIQDEISRGMVNSLRLKLGRGRRRYETSVEAYDLYLRARALPIQHGYGPGHTESIGPYQKAIAKDPSFAPAYAGLAAAYAYRSGEFRWVFADEMSKLRSAAEKAMQLDPLLAEANDALGMAYSRDAQWERSEKSFRRAIELDPNRSTSYSDFAMYLLWPLGRTEEALQQLTLAEKADPLSPALHLVLAHVLIPAGRYRDAAAHCEKLPANYPGKEECVGRTLLGQGRIGDAIRIMESGFNRHVSDGSQLRGELGYAYGRAGRREEAERHAAATSSLNPFNHALIFAGLGDKDRTLEALGRAAQGGPFRIGRALTFPEFALLRGDPRVKTLRKKVGLPD